MPLVIRQQYQNTVIAFGGSGIPLNGRSQTELIDLALLALSSQDPMIMNFFEDLPSEMQLNKMKMATIEKAVKNK